MELLNGFDGTMDLDGDVILRGGLDGQMELLNGFDGTMDFKKM